MRLKSSRFRVGLGLSLGWVVLHGTAGCAGQVPAEPPEGESADDREVVLRLDDRVAPLVSPDIPPTASYGESGISLQPLYFEWTGPDGTFEKTSTPGPEVLSRTNDYEGILRLGASVEPMSVDIAVYETPSEGEAPTEVIEELDCLIESSNCSVRVGYETTEVAFEARSGTVAIFKIMYPGPSYEAPANIVSWGLMFLQEN